MKRFSIAAFLLLNITLSFGQNETAMSMVDSLKYLMADSLDCKADLFWRIVAQGDKSIPFLIAKLTDTTPTNVRFHCKKGKLNVAEVAQCALTNIADFPASAVMHAQFDVIDDEGCWSFYEFFFMNSNKHRYQDSVRAWYSRERPKYKVVKVPKSELDECRLKYGIDTYYRWKE